jgi:hypothetical protein
VNGRRGRGSGGWRAALVSALIASTGLMPVVRGDQVPGFVEDWAGTDLHGWGGGSNYANPGTGGVGGAGDGFLLVSNTLAGHLGTFSIGAQYAGDWQAVGVTQVRLWLKDVNARQPLEIHFGLGSRLNFWQYKPGFAPPDTGWAMFTVDLAAESDWTRIIGTDTFANTLRQVNRVHLRHDRAPYAQSPDNIVGDVGIDRLQIVTPDVPVLPASWGRVKLLYR